MVPESDHLTLLNTYQQWKMNSYSGKLSAQYSTGSVIQILNIYSFRMMNTTTQVRVILMINMKYQISSHLGWLLRHVVFGALHSSESHPQGQRGTHTHTHTEHVLGVSCGW